MYIITWFFFWKLPYQVITYDRAFYTLPHSKTVGYMQVSIRLVGWLVYILVGWLVYILAGRLVGRYFGWLVGWSIFGLVSGFVERNTSVVFNRLQWDFVRMLSIACRSTLLGLFSYGSIQSLQTRQLELCALGHMCELLGYLVTSNGSSDCEY